MVVVVGRGGTDGGVGGAKSGGVGGGDGAIVVNSAEANKTATVRYY